MTDDGSSRPAQVRLAPIHGGVGVPKTNGAGILANHPAVGQRVRDVGASLRRGGLADRLTAIVGLRAAWHARCNYTFARQRNHGEKTGLSPEQIDNTAGPIDATLWSADELLLITMVDELCDNDCVSDGTWAALRSEWPIPQLIELILLSGYVRMMAGLLNSAGAELEVGDIGLPM